MSVIVPFAVLSLFGYNLATCALCALLDANNFSFLVTAPKMWQSDEYNSFGGTKYI